MRRAPIGQELRPLASDSNVRATESPQCLAVRDSAEASLNKASASTSVLQRIEWKFECRGDRC
jgi:hypothetical protein